MKSPNKQCQAFTLIELLVVVSIIALLVSILLPSLSKAREAAKNVKCMSQLRAMGQGIAMYAMDFNDRMPTSIITYTLTLSKGSSAVNEPRALYYYDSSRNSSNKAEPVGLGLLATGPYFGLSVKYDRDDWTTNPSKDNRPAIFDCPLKTGAWELYDNWCDYSYPRDTGPRSLTSATSVYQNFLFGSPFSKVTNRIVAHCLASGTRGGYGYHNLGSNFLQGSGAVQHLKLTEYGIATSSASAKGLAHSTHHGFLQFLDSLVGAN